MFSRVDSYAFHHFLAPFSSPYSLKSVGESDVCGVRQVADISWSVAVFARACGYKLAPAADLDFLSELRCFIRRTQSPGYSVAGLFHTGGLGAVAVIDKRSQLA